MGNETFYWDGLNNEKCKELRISFARNQPELQPIAANGQELKVTHRANNNKRLVMERSHLRSTKESFQMPGDDLFYRTLYQFFITRCPNICRKI